VLGAAIIAWSAAEAARGGTKTEGLEEAQQLPANNKYTTQHLRALETALRAVLCVCLIDGAEAVFQAEVVERR
jgi:hypothetical protein